MAERIKRINNFAVISNEGMQDLTGADWNDLATRVEKIEQWIEQQKQKEDFKDNHDW